ncbi:MAG: hypothetical protein AB7U75_07075 [Hyphomicrobiaceae bacterium]
MQNSNLSDELIDALARLQSSFEALATTREELGETVKVALTELTRQINEIDANLNSEPNTSGCSRTIPARRAA